MKIAIDFDGTLVDCSKRDYSLYTSIMSNFDAPVLTFDDYWPQRRSVCPISNIIKQSAGDSVSIENFLRLRHERSELPEYTRLDTPFPGVYFSLLMLSKYHDVYVVSARHNNSSLNQEIDNFGFRRFINGVISTGQLDKRDAIQSIGNVGMVIGDTEHDIRAAHALSIKVIAVTTGIRSREYLENLHPHFVVDTLIDTLNIIKE
jgi:phosphoglycolate phosphatase-like HAD superfamily hydrolase